MGANVVSIVGPNGGPGYSGNWPLANQVVFTTQPSNTAAGDSITPAVQVSVEDADNNVVTTDDSDVTIAITNPDSGTLNGTLTQTAVNGVATFNNLSIDQVGTGYTLTASDSNSNLATATSNPFNITTALASQLVFSAQPTNTAAGDSIMPAVQVTLENSSGTTATTDDSDVTLALGTNPSRGTLGGTLTVAAVNGVATFSNLSINNVGTGYTLTAADGSLSRATSGSFRITADRVTPTITWNTPTAILYGTALSKTQLDATASVPGSFNYAPRVGTVLHAESGQTLSVTFTPTDTTDYTTTTQTTTITVNKATPIISWPAPAPIAQGTALSNTQLDATDSWTVGGTLGRVAGQFVYTPNAGTVLPAGNQPLSAAFTPTDSTDYTTATASTRIAVVGTVSFSQSTIAVSKSQIAAGSTATVTLVARDALGNREPVGGLTVKFALQSSGAGVASGTFGSVKDNKDGTYTATFTAVTAGINTITATIGGQPVTATAPLTVVPGAVSLSKSMVTLTQSGVPVTSMTSGATATLTLVARDANGNQEGGLAVVFGLAKKAGSGSRRRHLQHGDRQRRRDLYHHVHRHHRGHQHHHGHHRRPGRHFKNAGGESRAGSGWPYADPRSPRRQPVSFPASRSP